jgi:hypothetical protein
MINLIQTQIIAFSKVPVHSNSNNIRLLQYREYKKNATSEFPKRSTLFSGQKILAAWEFKIAQLSKLLHTRVHKAKFMHLLIITALKQKVCGVETKRQKIHNIFYRQRCSL